MQLKIYQFPGIKKEGKRKLFKKFLADQKIDIFISYVFIFLSSATPIFSVKNGALYVCLWYTLSIIISWEMYINQFDYEIRRERANKYKRKHKEEDVENGVKFHPEIGGWTLIWAQILAGVIVALFLIVFSCYEQFTGFENYMYRYKDLCAGIFADTYILAFFSGCKKLLISELNDVKGTWREKGKALISKIKKMKIKELIIFIWACLIIILATKYYINNEFSKLFNSFVRWVIGIIYVAYMILST